MRGDSTYQRYDLSRLCDEAMRHFLVVLDQVANVDIAIVVLEERILTQLVSAMVRSAALPVVERDLRCTCKRRCCQA